MYKLLNANFFRLKKSKVFWGVIIITVILACIFLINSISNIEYIDNLLFSNINIIGLFIATFTSLFIGKEYAYGTIRNKIIVGHSRISIYLSNLIISILVSIFIEFIYILIIAVIGIPIVGGLEMSLSQAIYNLLEILLVIVGYCSIFNAITVLCADMTIATTVCMVLFIAMIIICGSLSYIVNIPENITGTFYDERSSTHY